MAGTRGPIPKRSAERRRQNKPDIPTDSVEISGPVEVPPANPKWHKLAIQLYESLEQSGQSKFFEPSDWAAAQVLAESMSRDLKPQMVAFDEVRGKVIRAYVPMKGASLAAYLKGFAALGMTEGDRRRIGIEVNRKPEKPALAKVSAMDDYRDAFNG